MTEDRIVILRQQALELKHHNSLARVSTPNRAGWVKVQVYGEQKVVNWKNNSWVCINSKFWPKRAASCVALDNPQVHMSIKLQCQWFSVTKSVNDGIVADEKDEAENDRDEYFDREGQERAQQFAANLFPDYLTETEYLVSGGFNSVIVIKIMDAQRCLQGGFILRMPKKPLDEVAFNNIIARHKACEPLLPTYFVPKVILSDQSRDNLLGRQYWLMFYVPGERIRSWENINRVEFATAVAHMMAAMFAVTFEKCGPLVAHPRSLRPVVGVPKFMSEDDPRSSAHGPGTLSGVAFEPNTDNLPYDLASFFKAQFSLLEQTCKDGVGRAFLKLAHVLLSSRKRISAKQTRNCLVHTDLFKRNILVSPACLERLSVVDWDDCEVLPCELAYFVPGWLWDSRDPPPPWYGYDPDEIPKDPRDQEVRTAFFATICSHIPNYDTILRDTRSSGLGVLGLFARRGTSVHADYFVQGLQLELLDRHGIYCPV